MAEKKIGFGWWYEVGSDGRVRTVMVREVPIVVGEYSVESKVESPQPDEPQPPHPEQQAQAGSDPGQNVPAEGVAVPIAPQGPQTPNRKDKTGRRGTECRDRWRLGIEIVAFVVGLAGIVLLLLTLRGTTEATKAATDSADAATRSANIAQRFLETSIRAWINNSGTKLQSDLIPNIPIEFVTTLKNVGKTPAQKITANLAMGFNLPCVCSPSGKKEERGSLGPGARFEMTANMNPPTINADAIEEMKQGRRTINLCGEILYEDEFSKTRRTTFNLFNDSGKKIFAVCPTGNLME